MFKRNNNGSPVQGFGSRWRGVEVCGCGVVAAETLILLVCYVKFEIPCYLLKIILRQKKTIIIIIRLYV